MKRYLAILLLLALASCGRDERPSFIVVMVDTLRRDHLGVYNEEMTMSPALDRLAGKGFRFTRAVAPSSWTKPSVASFFTGLYPGRHGAVLNPLAPLKHDIIGFGGVPYLDQRFTTLAERLQEAGYRTGAFVTNPHIAPKNQFDQGFDDFTQPAGEAEELLRKAREWIEAQGEAPYFLYLHLIDPHTDYFPPEAYREKFAGGIQIPRAPWIKKGDPRGINYWLAQYLTWSPSEEGETFAFDYQKFADNLEEGYFGDLENVTGQQIRTQVLLDFQGFDDPELLKRADLLERLYRGEVAYTNDAFDAFFTNLEQGGALDDTVLVVTSDHGEAFLEHRLWGHGHQLLTEQVDVPLFFRIPGVSGEFHEPVSLVDLHPTLLDLAGIQPQEGLDGCSLAPLLRGRGRLKRHTPVCAELFIRYADQAAVVVGDKKLVRMKSAEGAVVWQYYDMVADPGEHDPKALEAGGHEARSMARMIEKLVERRTRAFEGVNQTLPLTEEEVRELKALGYF
jgi:arylsulfatase A-like enzyme